MPELLFLAHRIPYPPDKGDKIRSWHVLSHLRRRFTIHLGCLIDDPDDWRHVATLQNLCGSSHFVRLRPWLGKLQALRGLLDGSALSFRYFWNRSLAAWVDTLHRDRSIDVQFVYSSSMAPYAERQSGFRGLRIVDFGDVDSDKWKQYAQSAKGAVQWIYEREARLMAGAELAICSRSDAALFVSEAEAGFFRGRDGVPEGRVHAVSNGVDTEFFSPDHRFLKPYSEGGPVLVFTGAMDYWANADAVLWFCDEVLPRVHERIPDARFAIVGSRPGATVTRMARDPGVLVTGRVADVRPWVAHATISVAPLRIARGIQNKVLEAMAMGRAVVASPQALEGIVAEPDVDLIMADGAKAFAGALIDLLGDAAERARLGVMARRRVVESYSWDRQMTALDRILEDSLVVGEANAAGSAGRGDSRPKQRQLT